MIKLFTGRPTGMTSVAGFWAGFTIPLPLTLGASSRIAPPPPALRPLPFQSPAGATTPEPADRARPQQRRGGGNGLIPLSCHGEWTRRFRWRARAMGEIKPIIAGTTHVNSEAGLLLNERDPFCWGIRG